jgi:hypothetical protein
MHALHCGMLRFRALFFVLKIIYFENFAWILEDFGVPIADSSVCFWLAFLLRTVLSLDKRTLKVWCANISS